jgi:hypothetical protein
VQQCFIIQVEPLLCFATFSIIPNPIFKKNKKKMKKKCNYLPDESIILKATLETLFKKTNSPYFAMYHNLS